jgi:hypothetical protein
MQRALDGTGLNAIDYRALPRSSKNHERNKAKHNIGARNQLGKWPGAPTQQLQTLQSGASLENQTPIEWESGNRGRTCRPELNAVARKEINGAHSLPILTKRPKTTWPEQEQLAWKELIQSHRK